MSGCKVICENAADSRTTTSSSVTCFMVCDFIYGHLGPEGYAPLGWCHLFVEVNSTQAKPFLVLLWGPTTCQHSLNDTAPGALFWDVSHHIF